MNASRRDFIKTSAAAFAAACVAQTAPSGRSDLIKKENARPGTRDWQLTRVHAARIRTCYNSRVFSGVFQSLLRHFPFRTKGESIW